MKELVYVLYILGVCGKKDRQSGDEKGKRFQKDHVVSSYSIPSKTRLKLSGVNYISSLNVISQAKYKPLVPVELKLSIADLSCIYSKTRMISLLVRPSE